MENLSKLLEQLAEQLGTTTEYLWQILLNQARIDFIASTFEYLLCGFLFYLSYRYFKYAWAYEDDPENPYSEKGIAVTVIGVMIGVLDLIMFCVLMSYIPMYLASIFNPEYWALQKILEQL